MQSPYEYTLMARLFKELYQAVKLANTKTLQYM